jgi:hypothetical protein
MAETLGDAVLVLRTDDSKFDSGLAAAEGKAESAATKISAIGTRMADAGKKLSLAVSLPLAALAVQSAKAATESNQAIAQVDAALASMGPTAGRTSEQLKGLAGRLEDISLFDDDDILKSVTANMLTFGNVTDEQFDRAQLAAVNLSARLGQDLKSSAIQVGKALNDPVTGITALSRVGVSFTAQQKEQVKAMFAAGDAAGAQKIILGELEKQFGGAAEAQRKATPTADSAQKWREYQEITGKIVLQVLPPLTSLLTSVLGAFNSLSPEVQTSVVAFLGVSAALGPLLTGFGGIAKGVGFIIPHLTKLGPIFTLLSGGIMKVIPIIANLGRALMVLALNPVFLSIAALVAGVYLAWQNWDKIKPIIDAVGAAISAWWNANVQPIFDAVGKKLGEVVDWFAGLPGKIGAAVTSVYNAVKSWLGDKLSTVWDLVKKGASKLWDFFASLPETVSIYMQAFYNKMVNSGREIIAGLAQGIRNAASAVWEALKSVVLAGINNIRAFLGIRSPSLLFQEMGGDMMDGLVLGIQGGIADVEAAMGELGVAIKEAAPHWGVDVDTGAMPGWESDGSGEAPGKPPPEVAKTWRDSFRDWFSDGLKAAAKGDLLGFLKSTLSGIGDAIIDRLADRLADTVTNLLDQLLGDVLDGIFSGGGGGGGGLFSGLFGGMFASGGTAPMGKWSIVGERGPEPILPTPNGTLVRPNSSLGIFSRSAPPARASVTLNMPIDATGADPAALDRVRNSIDRLRAELPGIIVGTTQEALDRRIIGATG